MAINKYSLKKIGRLNAEVPARIALCIRCGGKPSQYDEKVKHNGVTNIIHRVKCVGGRCEICHQPAGKGEVLEPHELPKRSAGGKVSLKDSKMCHRRCHRNQHSKPQLKFIRSK